MVKNSTKTVRFTDRESKRRFNCTGMSVVENRIIAVSRLVKTDSTLYSNDLNGHEFHDFKHKEGTSLLVQQLFKISLRKETNILKNHWQHGL